jgi:hypothetical protein
MFVLPLCSFLLLHASHGTLLLLCNKFNKHTGFLHTLKLQFSLPPFQFPRLIRAPPWCLQAAGVVHRPPLVAVDFCSLLLAAACA